MDERMTNPELAALLGPRAVALGFVGDEGIARLARLVSRRLGSTIAAPTVRSYLNGHRTPQHATCGALMDELALDAEDRPKAFAAIDAYYVRRRAAIAPLAEDDSDDPASDASAPNEAA